jgi:hypothetical protein
MPHPSPSPPVHCGFSVNFGNSARTGNFFQMFPRSNAFFQATAVIRPEKTRVQRLGNRTLSRDRESRIRIFGYVYFVPSECHREFSFCSEAGDLTFRIYIKR